MAARGSRVVHSLGMILGRSFFPIVALAIIVGTVLWGPWVSLASTLAFWLIVDRLESRS